MTTRYPTNLDPDQKEVKCDDMIGVPIKEKCSLVLYQKKASITGRYARDIGILSKYQSKKLIINLSCDPFCVQDLVSEEIALSCLVPKCKSSSPSMMLHQVASISLLRCYESHLIFEHQSSYSPDLYDTTLKIHYDITSDNLNFKIEKMPINILACAISKYKLLYRSQHLALLFDNSRKNDSRSLTDLFDLARKHASLSNENLLYNEDMLNFFISKKDNLGVSIMDHAQVIQTIMVDRLVENEDQKIRDDFQQDMLRMVKALKDKFQVKFQECQENRVYIFPPTYESSEEVITSRLMFKRIIIKGGILRLEKDSHKKQFFRIENRLKVPVPKKYYLDTIMYGSDKIEKNNCRVLSAQKLLAIYQNIDLIYTRILVDRATRKLKCDKTKDGQYIIPTHTLYQPTANLTCVEGEYKWPRLTPKSNRCTGLDIDPDHVIMLTEMDCMWIAEILSDMRDYHELRFRSRVCTAASNVYVPDIPFIVEHWYDSRYIAKCVIKGTVFDKDKGLLVVSYEADGILYRMEKWRLPDIENYSVAHHRLVTLACSISKLSLSRTQVENMLFLYARLLSENSWGNSRILKPLRYFCTGYLVRSPMQDLQIKKIIKEIEKNHAKYSHYYIMMLMAANIRSPKTDLTPLFGLQWKHIGWECFLLNLCPSSTYGRDKHLKDICSELYAEIELYKANIMNVQQIYQNFDYIVSHRKQKDSLRGLYMNHFRLIDNLRKNMDDRFTFTPASIVLLQLQISKLNIRYQTCQEQVPHITELMTARASYDTYSGQSSMAIQSIGKLTDIYKTSSTTYMAQKILNKKGYVDLLMWLFDKDQVGGNREISVLSGEFRVLQCIAERFMIGISKSLDNEFLNRPDKTQEFINRFQTTVDSKSPLFLTADQTKWGPNLNTVTFLLLSLLFSSYTTEYYIPAIIYAISEFKIFEVPIQYDIFYKNIDRNYSLPGMTARSHMGQGIFHVSSSVYHSLVIKSYLDVTRLAFNRYYNTSVFYPIYSTSLITSDDLCIMTATSNLDMKEKLEIQKSKPNLQEDHQAFAHAYQHFMEIQFKCIGNYLVLMGIKTSEYKNWISKDSCEFNSIFLSLKGIGQNDIKFNYSLIDPATTGNFFEDYRNVLNSYYDASSSGCSYSSLLPIVYGNYLKFCRHWKINLNLTGLPSLETIREGLLPWTIDQNDPFATKTETCLRYDTRDIAANVSYSPSILERQILENRFNSIQNTRSREAYRSIITHSKVDFFMNNCNLFWAQEAFGEEYEVFANCMNEDPSHIRSILKDNEIYSTAVVSERETKGKLFEVMTIRKTEHEHEDLYSLLLSYNSYPAHVNCHSSSDELFLHMLRKYKTSTVLEDSFDIRGKSIPEQILKLKELEETRLGKGNATMIRHNPDRTALKYPQCKVITPITSNHARISCIDILCNDFDYNLEYSDTTAYVAMIKKTLNGFMEQRRCNGYKTCIYKDILRETVTMPTIENLMLYSTDNIYEIEKEYTRDRECYLNIRIQNTRMEKEDEAPKLDNDLFNTIQENENNLQFNLDTLASANIELQLDDILGDLGDFGDSGGQPILNPYDNEEEVKREPGAELDGTTLDIESLYNLKTGYLSIKISTDYLCYSRDYYSKRILICQILSILHDRGIIKGEMRDNYYYEVLNEMSLQTSDIKLSNKVNVFVSNSLSTLSTQPGDIHWDHLALDAINELPPVANGYMKHYQCFWTKSGNYSVTEKPIGEIVDYDTFFQERMKLPFNLMYVDNNLHFDIL